MKLLSSFEIFVSPFALVLLNIAIILSAEFYGGGSYFAETGLAYAIGVIFVALIIVRIFSDYAFSDPLLKGFLRIQLTFLMFLGLVQLYEYIALRVWMIRPDVVQLTVVASYFVWTLSLFLALSFIFHIYYKQSLSIMYAIWALFIVCIVGLIAPNVSPDVVAWFPVWFPKLILTGIVVFGVAGLWSIRKLCEVMPVFTEYSYYAIPATILLMLTGFSEYFEATGTFGSVVISPVQNVYVSHFLVYIALSLLIVGFGKLKKPQGIYEGA